MDSLKYTISIHKVNMTPSFWSPGREILVPDYLILATGSSSGSAEGSKRALQPDRFSPYDVQAPMVANSKGN